MSFEPVFTAVEFSAEGTRSSSRIVFSYLWSSLFIESFV